MLNNLNLKILTTKLFLFISSIIGFFYFTSIFKLNNNYDYMFEPLLCWSIVLITFILIRIFSQKLNNQKLLSKSYFVEFRITSLLNKSYLFVRIITFLIFIVALFFVLKYGITEARLLYFTDPQKIYILPYIRELIVLILLPITIISESVLIWDFKKKSIYRGRIIHFLFLTFLNFGRFYLYHGLFFCLLRFLIIKNMRIFPRLSFKKFNKKINQIITFIYKKPLNSLPLIFIISYIFYKMINSFGDSNIATNILRNIIRYFEILVFNYHLVGFGIFFSISDQYSNGIKELSSCTLVSPTYHYFRVFIAKLGFNIPLCGDILSQPLETPRYLEGLNHTYNAFGTNLIRWFFSFSHLGTVMLGVFLGLLCSLIFLRFIYAPVTIIGFFLLYFGLFIYNIGSPFIIFSLISLLIIPKLFIKTTFLKRVIS